MEYKISVDAMLDVVREHGDGPETERLLADLLAENERARRDALVEAADDLEERLGQHVPHEGGSAGVYERSPKGDEMWQWSYGNAVAYTGASNEVLAWLRERAALGGEDG